MYISVGCALTSWLEITQMLHFLYIVHVENVLLSLRLPLLSSISLRTQLLFSELSQEARRTGAEREGEGEGEGGGGGD